MDTTLIQAKGVSSPINSLVQKPLPLQRTNPFHFSNVNETYTGNAEKGIGTEFADMLLGGLEKVSELENFAIDIAKRSQLDPLIDEHDVSIASAKASMAIQLTRSMIDRALEAYRSIISLR